MTPFDDEERKEPEGAPPDETPELEGEGCAGEAEATPRRRVPKDPRKYVASWSERDSLDGKEAHAWVLILRTCGCGWARCAMCGYHGESSEVGPEDLLHQFQKALENRKGATIAKLYTSGSFFDEREVPAPARNAILAELGKGFERVVVESRPQFIHEKLVRDAVALCRSLEVAIGLESANARVLSHSVRKGFTFEDFAERAKLAREWGARVRTYILLKPPFLNEKEALEDSVASLEAAAPLSDTLSLNPVNVQRGTVVEQLWKRRIFRPPWLWSAAEAVLRAHRRIRDKGLQTRLVCAPSGAGRSRGAHNCGNCDEGFTSGLEEYSISGDPGPLELLLASRCPCKEEWLDALEMGTFPHVPYDAVVNKLRQ
jgi:hypothetical protein